MATPALTALRARLRDRHDGRARWWRGRRLRDARVDARHNDVRDAARVAPQHVHQQHHGALPRHHGWHSGERPGFQLPLPD